MIFSKQNVVWGAESVDGCDFSTNKTGLKYIEDDINGAQIVGVATIEIGVSGEFLPLKAETEVLNISPRCTSWIETTETLYRDTGESHMRSGSLNANEKAKLDS